MNDEKVFYWTQILFPFSYQHNIRMFLDEGSIESIECRLVGQSNRYHKKEKRLVLFDKYYLSAKFKRLFFDEFDFSDEVILNICKELLQTSFPEELKLKKYEHLSHEELLHYFLVKKEIAHTEYLALRNNLPKGINTDGLTDIAY